MKNSASSILILFALITLLWCGAVAQKRSAQINLITTGEFHGEEITAKSGERWLGLFQTSGGFALLPATLKVEMVHDVVIDENPHVKTGKKVSVNRAREPVFLLKGAGFLRGGAVSAVFSGVRNLGNGEIVDLSLNGKSYQLKVVSDNPTPDRNLLPNSKLIFSTGAKSQVVFSVKVPNDGGWSLLWAGDLDGDGRLDLYMDLHNNYNSSQSRLFLSSQAARGNLVKEVAEFTWVGC